MTSHRQAASRTTFPPSPELAEITQRRLCHREPNEGQPEVSLRQALSLD